MAEKEEKEITEEILDEFIETELKKDITQEDKVDESVEKHLQEMGFLWDRLQRKFIEDKICFSCKKEVELTGEDVRVVEATSVDKGVIAFVSICQKCFETEHNKHKEDEVKKNE